MLAPKNYTLGECLHTGPGVDVHAATRISDGADVVLKSYAGDDAEGPGSRAEREFLAMRAADGPGVPRALALIADTRPAVLVVERVPGASLAQLARVAPLAPLPFVALAIQLAQVLARMHATAWLHCGLTPESVRIDRATSRIHLVDFGDARMLGSAQPGPDGAIRAHDLASAFAYMAPEQTGRMARGVDARSDLYALGALLYFALTGHPPFDSDDPLALVHAHMARMPVPPMERRPDVPATLSRIVLKLLQKEPVDRYQTAAALVRDLITCRDQLQRTGRIADDFPLGTADVPVRPLFSTRLHGRESEIQRLHAAYEQTVAGGVELLLLSGPAGAGKSALLHELRPALAATAGHLAQGKFDLYRREVPYSGIVAALASLIHQILSETEASVARWRRVLEEALGKLAGVVIELVPDLRILVPDPPPVPSLGPRETQARLFYVLQRLVLACGGPEHPLVLFLDDLQWADPGSLAVLDALLAPSGGAYLLVVATCRDDEPSAWSRVSGLVDDLQRRGVDVARVAVAPLGTDAVAELLADALGQPASHTRALADCVAAKTASNPLWIQQFVLHVHELGLIRYSHPEGWAWDAAAIAAADIPEGAVELMVAKLERLAPEPRAVLELASCVGDELELDVLCELRGEPRASLERPLFELAREGLIAPSARGFRFVHDRIREAAQALLSAEERARLHHRTGLHWLRRAPLAIFTDQVFEIADHLNRGISCLSGDERTRALEANAAAGTRALSVGASETAQAYLSVAHGLFRESDWETSPELSFNLHIQSAEAAYQTLDMERALQILDALDARSLPRVHQAGVAARRIMCFVVSRPDDVFELMLAELRRFGMRLPRRASLLRAWIEVEYTDWLFRRSPLDASAFGRRPSDDPAWAAPLMIFSAGGAVLLRDGGAGLLCILTCKALRRLRRYGAPPGTSQALAAFAALRGAMSRDVEGTKRYVKAIFEWMERHPSPLDVRARLILHCFALPFLQPRRSLLEPLQRIAQTARELGDPEYAVYTSGYRWAQMAFCGEPLEVLIEEADRLARSVRTELVRRLLRAVAAPYALLHDPLGEVRDWSEDPPEMAAALILERENEAFLALHWFMALCYLGQFERAAELSPRFTLRALGINPSSALDCMMFRAICASVDAERQPRRWPRLRAAARLQAGLLVASRSPASGPDFVHMRLVVRAESARLRGDFAGALALYQRASTQACECHYRHHAALIHERRSSLLRAHRRDLEARSALAQAADLYEEWGALAKLRQLQRTGLLSPRPRSAPRPSTRESPE